jgi:hypothetical protein
MFGIRQLINRLGTRTSQGASNQSRLLLERLEDRLQPSSTSVITSNFNGTPIHAGDSIWFNSVAKVSGLGSAPVNLQVVDASVDFKANGTVYHVPVPDASITFSPTATTATTTFDVASNTWKTTTPMNPGGNVFLAGVTLPTPAGLPGGINPVSWTATFQSDTAGISVNWQWAAAAYTTFGPDYLSLNVKPVDSNQLSSYANSDHAGTPEAYRSYVTGGVRGGGGSNFTGSYSATGHATAALITIQPPPQQTSQPASLSGNVADIAGGGVQGAILTLTGTDSNGNSFTLTAMTDINGDYTINDIPAGTNYTLTETLPAGYFASSATAGTDNTHTDGSVSSSTQVVSISLNPGDSAVGYNFTAFTNSGV